MSANPKKKTALVLAGGGFPGYMYEVGCLAALDAFFEDGFSVNDFDIYVGTSAGAAVASLLANQSRAHEIFEAIRDDTDSPFNFTRSDIYSFGYKETWKVLKRLVRSMGPLARYLIKNRKRSSFLDAIHLLEENLPSGFFVLDNFDRYLTRFFSYAGYTNDFRQLKRELYIPAVNIDSGRYDVFGELGFDDVTISKAVTASSAMPVMFQPVTINGKDYVDGGVGRVAYMDIAINHGAGLILVINPVQYVVNDRRNVCIRTLAGEPVGLKDKGLSFIFDQALRINSSTRMYFAMKRYGVEHPDRDILLIQPEPHDSVMFMYNVVNFANRHEVLNYGYVSTVQVLKREFPTYEKCFAKLGIRVSLDRFTKVEEG